MSCIFLFLSVFFHRRCSSVDVILHMLTSHWCHIRYLKRKTKTGKKDIQTDIRLKLKFNNIKILNRKKTYRTKKNENFLKNKRYCFFFPPLFIINESKKENKIQRKIKERRWPLKTLHGQEKSLDAAWLRKRFISIFEGLKCTIPH